MQKNMLALSHRKAAHLDKRFAPSAHHPSAFRSAVGLRWMLLEAICDRDQSDIHIARIMKRLTAIVSRP